MNFKVGDKVELSPPSTGEGEWISGTVIEVQHDGLLSVRRDDDKSGAGKHYVNSFGEHRSSWLVGKSEVRLMAPETQTWATNLTPEKHTAGLSPEEVDWDAHKAFTRDMK